MFFHEFLIPTHRVEIRVLRESRVTRIGAVKGILESESLVFLQHQHLGPFIPVPIQIEVEIPAHENTFLGVSTLDKIENGLENIVSAARIMDPLVFLADTMPAPRLTVEIEDNEIRKFDDQKRILISENTRETIDGHAARPIL